MNKSAELILILEVISSKFHTEIIFDDSTVDSIKRVFIDGTKRYVNDPSKEFKVSSKQIKQFIEYISEQLNKLPSFLHNKIHFEPEPIKDRYIFGEGSHNTFNDIMIISVNSNISIKTWKNAWNNNFRSEIQRLRSVIRHELAHRVHLQRANKDPIKRLKGRKFRKLMTPHKNSHRYYGMPTEILAHANHTVELITFGDEHGWKEVIARYALTDSSRNFKNTKRLVSTIAKLMAEYNVPWMERMKLKRELIKIAKVMRTNVRNLGIDEIDKAVDVALSSDTLGMSKSSDFIATYGNR